MFLKALFTETKNFLTLKLQLSSNLNNIILCFIMYNEYYALLLIITCSCYTSYFQL